MSGRLWHRGRRSRSRSRFAAGRSFRSLAANAAGRKFRHVLLGKIGMRFLMAAMHVVMLLAVIAVHVAALGAMRVVQRLALFVMALMDGFGGRCGFVAAGFLFLLVGVGLFGWRLFLAAAFFLGFHDILFGRVFRHLGLRFLRIHGVIAPFSRGISGIALMRRAPFLDHAAPGFLSRAALHSPRVPFS